MSKRAQIIEALKICEKYDGGGYICSGHDILYALPDSVAISLEDATELQRLGFFRDSESGSWACFT